MKKDFTAKEGTIQMQKDLRIFIIAYPDNPVGTIFFKTFIENDIPICGIVVESKKGGANWNRFRKKIHKDGLYQAFGRLFHVLRLKRTGQNIVRLAQKYDIPVYEVDRMNSEACSDLLASLDIDLLVIASAPILKDYIFQKAKIGCLNAHPGWLPQYRGLGANAYALMNGDSPGISIHFVDKGIDTGNIIAREKIEVYSTDSIAKVNDRAVTRGASLMVDVIRQIQNDALVMPHIKEHHGKLYKAMPYALAKKVNKKIKSFPSDYHLKYSHGS